MSAMEDMLANMLKKALPPEIMALMTPEKMQEFGDNINAFKTNHNNEMKNISEQLEASNKKLDLLLERTENDRQNNNSSGRKSTGNRSKSGGSGEARNNGK